MTYIRAVFTELMADKDGDGPKYISAEMRIHFSSDHEVSQDGSKES